jgi:hypothetical protein
MAVLVTPQIIYSIKWQDRFIGKEPLEEGPKERKEKAIGRSIEKGRGVKRDGRGGLIARFKEVQSFVCWGYSCRLGGSLGSKTLPNPGLTPTKSRLCRSVAARTNQHDSSYQAPTNRSLKPSANPLAHGTGLIGRD